MIESNRLIDNVELMKEWDYEKNIELMPEFLSLGSHKKAWWKCKKCGYGWESEIRIRNNSYGCPVCSKKKKDSSKMNFLIKKNGSLQEKNPELIEEWDYEKNSPFTPNTIVFNSSRKIWWKCKSCGFEWCAVLYHRTQTGTGCPKCAQQYKSQSRLKTLIETYGSLAEHYPDLISEWHPTKNGKLTPNNIMAYSNKKVWWICPKGHEYEATPNNRNKPSGCPICKSEKQTSIPEKIIFYYISKVFPDAIPNFQTRLLGKKELDIFIPGINLAIEYDGEAWHKNKDKDLEKAELCAKNNITLIRFREPKCVNIDDDINSVIYKLDHNINDNQNMNKPLKWLFEYINNNYQMNIDINIDVENDYDDILSKIQMYEKENSIAALRPDLLEKFDYEKNKNISPFDLSIASHKRVWWLCKNNHSYQSRVATIARGGGCPECAKTSRVIERKKTYLKNNGSLSDKFPQLLEEWNYDKNKSLKPSELTTHTHKKVWWKCKECGYEWESTVDNRVKG